MACLLWDDDAARPWGYADFEGHQTWYLIVGDLVAARSGHGPAPLVTLHGGPGGTHDYLLSMADLADDGRAVVFYDQTGNGNSTHFPDRGADYFTVGLFGRELSRLIEHLDIGGRYHVLGQPRTTPPATSAVIAGSAGTR